MTAFRFESISAQDAANFSTADSLAFDGANASQVTVLYGTDRITIAFGGRSMEFGLGIQGQTGTRLADGSMLYVGAGSADNAVGTAFGDGIYGGAGGDSLDGADGGDLLQGNQGDDSLIGGAGSDVIYGGQDNDQIRLAPTGSAAPETNFANGNRGDDVLLGGPGSDTILGGQGLDVISAGDGGDFVNGNLGDDVLQGDGGEDSLSGEGGADFLTGGDGSDLFLFAAGSSNAALQMKDSILDWTASDRIRILGAQAGYAEVTAPMIPGYRYGGYEYPPSPGDESYPAILALVNQTLAASPAVGVVAAKTGFDVIVFADTDGDRLADLAITLSGATLFDISADNLA